MSTKNKLIKEAFGEQGLTTPEVFNRIDSTGVEKVIRGVLNKTFKDYTLEAYRHQGETQYINLNLLLELDEPLKNLEFERFTIATKLAQFRQDFFTELSKYINVVNIKTGPFDYVKNSSEIKFNVTVLLSDNNISDWVTGIRKKPTESKKEFVQESKKINLKEYYYEPDKLRHAEFTYPLSEFKEDLYTKLTDEYNISFEAAENLLGKYEKYIKDSWYEEDGIDHLAKVIATKYNPSKNINEVKVSKAFNTGDKDEWEVQNKLRKNGFKVSVIKDKEVKVTWNDKKHSEQEIRKLIESNTRKLRVILESLYNQVLKEARPKKSDSEEENKPVDIDPVTEKSLKKLITEFQSLKDELNTEEEEFRKLTEKRYTKLSGLEQKIFETMKSVNLNLYVIDKVTAKISKAYTRENVKYKSVVEETIEALNDTVRKVIKDLKLQEKLISKTGSTVDDLIKKHTKSSEIPSQLDITKKESKIINTDKILKENIFKNAAKFLKDLYNSLFVIRKSRKTLEKIVEKL